MKINTQTFILLLVIGVFIKFCGEPKTPSKESPGPHAAVTSMKKNQDPIPLSPEVDRPQEKTLYVGPSTLNVRSSPNGTIIDTLRHGTEVNAYVEENGWTRISSDEQKEKWVSSAYLCKHKNCSDMPKWKPKPVTSTPQRRASSSITGCPCSSNNNCFGPRGGRYCITSGGNKRYR